MSEVLESLRCRAIRPEGIHFHNGCLGESWQPTLETVKRIAMEEDLLGSDIKWLNLGGGVVWDRKTDFGALNHAVELVRSQSDAEVLIEPGAGLVNNAGFLIASVVDIFCSGGEAVAVLDTSVNHLPEVFEYGFEPDVIEDDGTGQNEYILAGSSCLAGDLFGKYRFKAPLRIGSRVTFANIGAYSLVKANMFNGINLPSIYVLDERGQLSLSQEFTFDDFAARCGADEYKHADF